MIANIQTTPENEFVKAGVAKYLSASNDFIAAFITFTDEGASALQNNDEAAVMTATTALTTAGDTFQTATADTTAKNKKALLVAAYKTQLTQITTKQGLVDAELTKVKALN